MALNSVFSWFIKKRIHQIQLFMKYPHEVQGEVFEKLIHSARDTEWGKKHGYGDINSAEDFKNRVPIQDYDDVKPYIERMKKGEQNLLWPTDIKWFAKSSGTTSDRSKYIPMSRESLEDCHYKGGKDLLALYYHNNPNAKLYNGKSLVIGGSSTINEFREDSYVGDLSAIIINNLPFWVELKRTPGKNIALMGEWEEKIEKMARITMNENVTNAAGVPSWTLVLFRRILEITGEKRIIDVWPNLELFMHGGVSFSPYREQYDRIIGKQINYYENYNASEGFFGIQDRNNADDMLLMLDYGIFYEFIPADNALEEDPPIVQLSEVEKNVPYAMVISTNGGLWRYRIGDTVRFTELNPYRIQVAGRTTHFINTFGEELIVNNAERAIARASEKLDCEVADFTAGPVYMDTENQGSHEWLIEFRRSPADLEQFTKALDESLREINSDYDAKRTADLTLRLPVVHELPQGTFYSWMKSRGKLGGQNKVPRLKNDRKYIDNILEFSRARNIAS